MERTKDQFFDEAMYMVHVTGWPTSTQRPNLSTSRSRRPISTNRSRSRIDSQWFMLSALLKVYPVPEQRRRLAERDTKTCS